MSGQQQQLKKSNGSCLFYSLNLLLGSFSSLLPQFFWYFEFLSREKLQLIIYCMCIVLAAKLYKEQQDCLSDASALWG